MGLCTGAGPGPSRPLDVTRFPLSRRCYIDDLP